MTKKHKMWLAGGVLGAVVVGGLVWAASAKAAVPAGPVQGYTSATTLTSGKNYGIAAQLPTGVTDQAGLVTALNNAGWTNVQVVFFGPTAPTVPAGLMPPTPIRTAYVASGTWNGANGAAVPANATVVQAP